MNGGGRYFAFFRHPAVHAMVLIAVAFAAYSNSFDVPFQFDDTPNIVDNPLIKDFKYFGHPSLAEDVPMKYLLRFKSRMAGYFTFALNYRLHGLDVRGYHAFNLFVHIINALLLYWLVLLCFRAPALKGSAISERSGEVALLSALIFVSHPIQMEAVTFVVQRLASLTALFYILSLALYAKFRLAEKRKAVYFVLALISAALAMKTKEIAFTLPAAIALYEFIFFPGGIKQRLARIAPFALVSLIIPLSLIVGGMGAGDVMGSMGEATKLIKADVTRSEYLMTEFRVIATYLRLLALPVNQDLDYGYPVYGAGLPLAQVLSSLLLLVGVFTLGVFALRRSRRGEPALALVAMGVFWFFTAISVESSVIPIEDVIFEHRVYLPSLGLSMAVGAVAVLAMNGLARRWARRAAVIAMALVILSLAAATHARNTVWQSAVSLWSDTVEKSPGKARPHNNLAAAYIAAGDLDRAIEQYELASSLEPGSAVIHTNLGAAYSSKADYTRAIAHLNRAMELDPQYVEAHTVMAQILVALRQYDGAVEQLLKVVELRPNYMDAYINLGILYNSTGRPELGARHLGQAVSMRPDLAPARYNLANAYMGLGRVDEAIEQYQEAIRLVPVNPAYHQNLSAAYRQKGLEGKAEEEAREAERLRRAPGK